LELHWIHDELVCNILSSLQDSTAEILLIYPRAAPAYCRL